MTWIGIAAFLVLLGGGLFFLRRERQARRTLEKKVQELNGRLKNALERLEMERARLETTFSGMVEGVLLTDARGDILHTNPAFREMFGLAREVEGRSALEVLASVASDDAIRKVIQTGEPAQREIEFEKPKRRVFQVNFSPLRRDGKLSGVVSVFHDLTEIRRLEEVRRDFVANLSHELKTPLTAIRGFSETLLEESGDHPPESRRAIEVIFRHATELSHLMENLLNLSQIESGREELRLEEISVRPFVDQLLERFSMQARTKGIELLNKILDDTPSLKADPAKLNQILSNLIDNAVKYTPEGGKVWIRCQKGERGFCIEVEDTGPGIPTKEQERVFERFYRVDKARSRDSGGSGLGLAIVKHLVGLHGGDIAVESQPGQGSRFKISFPRPL